MKYILRIGLVVILMAAMLLCAIPVYADDPPGENEGGNPGESEGNPGDRVVEGSGLQVQIDIVGDNPQVGVDVIGEDSEVMVNTTGTEIWINGQNLGSIGAQPGVYPGEEGVWAWNAVLREIVPWMRATENHLGLTMNGVTKLILELGEHESQITAINKEIGNDIHHELAHNQALIEVQKIKLSTSTYLLASRISDTEEDLYVLSELGDARYAEMQAQIAALEQEIVQRHQISFRGYEFGVKVEYLVLAIIVFFLMIIGLSAGLGITIYKLRRM